MFSGFGDGNSELSDTGTMRIHSIKYHEGYEVNIYLISEIFSERRVIRDVDLTRWLFSRITYSSSPVILPKCQKIMITDNRS